MQLQIPESSGTSDFQYLVFAFIHKYSHRVNSSRQPPNNLSRLCGSNVTRAPQIEIKSQKICARLACTPRIHPARDPANLQLHSGHRWLTPPANRCQKESIIFAAPAQDPRPSSDARPRGTRRIQPCAAEQDPRANEFPIRSRRYIPLE